jgi:hypothetical protein
MKMGFGWDLRYWNSGRVWVLVEEVVRQVNLSLGVLELAEK